MNNGLLVLKLILDELGVPSNIDKVNDRKRVQKTVYLAQLSGVDLGYRYGWYLMGPYSSTLTRDYYSLAEVIALGDRDWEGKALRDAVKERLEKIRPLLSVPEQVALQQEDWLELLASLHYLRKVRGQGGDEARRTLREEKPLLAPFAPQAQQALEVVGLLPTVG